MSLAVGTKINYWEVIAEPYVKGGRTFYPCRCLCGHEQPVRQDNLTGGHSHRHRGCKWKEELPEDRIVDRKWKYKAEINRTEENILLKNSYIGCFFGEWLVVAVDHSTPYGHTYYRCLNEKGNTQVIRYDGLTGKYGFPEGKHNVFVSPTIDYTMPTVQNKSGSIGEQAIVNFLDNNCLLYEREYVFEDLRGDGACLRFDFKIEHEGQIILIEFQGKQHYEPIEFFGGKEQFELQQRYDSYKRSYCAAHNYKLIEIPYTEIDKINEYLNFLQKNKEEA